MLDQIIVKLPVANLRVVHANISLKYNDTEYVLEEH